MSESACVEEKESRMRRGRKSYVIAVQWKSTGALFLTAEGKGYCAAFLSLLLSVVMVENRHRNTVLFLVTMH